MSETKPKVNPDSPKDLAECDSKSDDCQGPELERREQPNVLKNVEPLKVCETPAAQDAKRDGDRTEKEEMIAKLKRAAEELGRAPNAPEFWRSSKVKKYHIRRLFGGYGELLKKAGFEAGGPGYEIANEKLFEDWARVVRKLGRIPSIIQYDKNGLYSYRAFKHRWDSWTRVPAAMVRFAAGKWLEQEWEDVLKIAQKYTKELPEDTRKAKWSGQKAAAEHGLKGAARKAAGPLYGRPMVMQTMATAPTNESGVLLLFGALARQLGFMILRVQTEFPDVEALRLCEGDEWRLQRIEVEFESRNFFLHGHDADDCDLIVCWKHNWQGSPVEVLELSGVEEK